MENTQYRELNGFTEELRDELSAINARMIAYARETCANINAWASVWCARELSAAGTLHDTVWAHEFTMVDLYGSTITPTTVSHGFDPYTESPYDLVTRELSDICARLLSVAGDSGCPQAYREHIRNMSRECAVHAAAAWLRGESDRQFMADLSTVYIFSWQTPKKL